MDITCGDCGARFRLDRALLKGAKGARVRCRRCGGYNVVRDPDTPQIFPDVVVTLEVPGIPVDKPEGESLPSPEGGMTAGSYFSGGIQPEPVESTPDGMPYRSDPVGVEQEPAPDSELENVYPYLFHVPTEGSARIEVESGLPPDMPEVATPEKTEYPLDGLFQRHDVPDAGPDRDEVRDKSAAGMAAPEPRPRASLRRRPSRSTIFLFTAVCILLLAGGALYFGTPESGQGPFGKLFPWRGKIAQQNPFYDVRGVQWHTEKEIGGDNLYVIRGTVANVGRGPGNGVRIQAVAWGKDNQVLMKKTGFAGNSLDDTLLRNLRLAMIEQVLNNRDGEGRVNLNIPTGKSLPFMVVISGSSEPVESITVKATDVNEPVSFPFPDGKDTEQSSLSQRTIPLH